MLGECFNSVPDFHLKECTPGMKVLFQVLAKLGSEPETNKSLILLSTADSLLNANEWAQGWAKLLISNQSLDALISDVKTKFGLPDLPGETEIDEMKKKNGENGNDKESKEEELRPGTGDKFNHKDANPNKKESQTTSDASASDNKCKKNEVSDTQTPAETEMKPWTLATINSFTNSQPILGQSAEAAELKLQDASTIFLRRFEVALESVVWRAWNHILAKNPTSADNFVVIDPSAAKDMFQVKYPMESGLVLPFLGHVSLSSGDAKANSVYLTTVFGVNFYIQPVASVCAPAWSVKTVTRHDQAYFALKTNKLAACCFIPDVDPTVRSDCVPLEMQIIDDKESEEEYQQRGSKRGEMLYMSNQDTHALIWFEVLKLSTCHWSL